MRPHIEISHASRSLDIPVMRCSRQVCRPSCERLQLRKLRIVFACIPIADASRCLARRRFKATFSAPAVHGPVGAARIGEIHQLRPSLARQKHKRSQCVPLSVPSLLRSHRRSHRTTSLGITRTRQLPGQPGRPSECVRPTIVRPKVEGRASLTPSGKLEGGTFHSQYLLTP